MPGAIIEYHYEGKLIFNRFADGNGYFSITVPWNLDEGSLYINSTDAYHVLYRDYMPSCPGCTCTPVAYTVDWNDIIQPHATPYSDPVDPFTGLNSIQIQDFKLMGKNGLDFELIRNYRADLRWNRGALGKWWLFNYESQIIFSGTDNMMLIDTDGRQLRYTLESGNYVTSSYYKNYDLTKEGPYFVLYKKDERKKYYYYDMSSSWPGKLHKISNLNDDKIVFTYDYGGRIYSAQDTLNRQIIFGTVSGQYIVKLSTGTILAAYTHNADGLLTDVTGYQLDCHYTYWPDGLMNIKTQTENKAAKGYSSVEYHYDAAGRVTDTYAPAGHMHFDYRYLNNGNHDSAHTVIKNFGSPARLWHEPINAVQTMQKPFKTIVTNYEGQSEEVYFGGTGQTERVIVNGKTTENVLNLTNYHSEYTLDDKGNQTGYEYDSDNFITKITKEITTQFGAGKIISETNYQYTNGLLTQITDPRGNIETRQYNSAGQITNISKGNGLSNISFTYPSADQTVETKYINYNNHPVTTEKYWNYSNENAITYTEILNNITLNIITYDRFGRVAKKQSPSGIEYYSYSEDSNKSLTIGVDRPGNNNDINMGYDKRGNLMRSTIIGGKQVQYAYYPDDKLQAEYAGNVSKIYAYKPLLDANQGKISSITEGTRITAFNYYPDGRINTQGPNNETTTYSYNDYSGLSDITAVDHQANQVVDTMNEQGLLLRKDKTAYPNHIIEDYKYDPNGNRVEVTQGSIKYIYKYDALNRVTETIYEDGSSEQYYYDQSNNLIKREFGTEVVEYRYNDYNSLIEIKANGKIVETFDYYDGCSSCGGGGGKLKSDIISNYGKIEYEYTPEGWLYKSTYMPSDSLQTVIENTYYPGGILKTVKLDGNLITTYGYSAQNFWQTSIVDTSGVNPNSYNIGFDSRGNRIQIDFPNKTRLKYEYDNMYRINKANGVLVKTDGSEDFITKNEVTARDGVGNIKTKNIMTGQVSYNYDSTYQLTNYDNPVNEKGNIQYQYDLNGNMTNLTENSGASLQYSFGISANKVLNITPSTGVPTTFAYDERGNMIRKGNSTYSWDYKNRLVGAKVGNENIAYKYNYGDLRLEKIIHGVKTRFFYNGSQLLCEKGGSGKTMKIYTNDNEGKLAMTRYIYENSSVLKNKQSLYYLFDELGSVNAVTNEAGLPVQYYIYDPWGNITNMSNDPINNLTFIGRYDGWRDWDTGLTQFVHRWYDSQLGRWISKDPIGIGGGINIYEYVKNNPPNNTDIYGYIVDGRAQECGPVFRNCIDKIEKDVKFKYPFGVVSAFVDGEIICHFIPHPGGRVVCSVAYTIVEIKVIDKAIEHLIEKQIEEMSKNCLSVFNKCMCE